MQDNNEMLAKILEKMESLENSVAKVEKSIGELQTYVNNQKSKEQLEPQDKTLMDGKPKDIALFELVEKIEKISSVVEQAPGLISMVVDSVDEIYQQMPQGSAEVENRFDLLVRLFFQLSEGKNIQTFSILVDKLTEIRPLLENVQILPFLAMLVDMADEFYKDNLSHVDVIENLKGSLQIFVELTKPETAEIVSHIFDKDKGLVPALSHLLSSKEFEALMKSGILDPKTIRIIASMGDSLVDCEGKIRSFTFGSGLRSLFDKDVRKSLGFLISFAKLFGQKIDKNSLTTSQE